MIRTFFLVSILFFGCAAKPETFLPIDQVKVGMGVTDVADLLGPPGNVRFSKDLKEEVWQYCLDERFKPVNNVTVVWFYERKATGVHMYKNIGFGSCESFFRKLKWEDAPHRKSGLTESRPIYYG